jgi:hypothetical protein
MSAESFAVADDVAWLPGTAHDSDTIYATRLPDGPPVVLPGTGGLIFVAAASGGTLEEILERVSEDAGVDREDIRDDVASFVEELLSLGLLARR